jgi:hypothetical protein
MTEAVVPPQLFRARMEALSLRPRAAAKLLGLGKNGERSVRRMLAGQKSIPKRFASVLDDALKGRFPDHYKPEMSVCAGAG